MRASLWDRNRIEFEVAEAANKVFSLFSSGPQRIYHGVINYMHTLKFNNSLLSNCTRGDLEAEMADADAEEERGEAEAPAVDFVTGCIAKINILPSSDINFAFTLGFGVRVAVNMFLCIKFEFVLK